MISTAPMMSVNLTIFVYNSGGRGVTEKAKHFELLTKTIHASVEREPLSENPPSSCCHSRDD
jgi:hypothetical protein